MTDDLNATSVDYVEELYAEYLENPKKVPAEWQGYFASWGQNGNGHGEHISGNGNGHAAADGLVSAERSVQLRPSFKPSSIFNPAVPSGLFSAGDTQAAVQFQQKVDQLVWNFRLQGHLLANVDPLKEAAPQGSFRAAPGLDPAYFGFSEADLDRPLPIDPLASGSLPNNGSANGRNPSSSVHTLRELIAKLRTFYAGHIGVEYMHITSPEIRGWVQQRMEVDIDPPMAVPEKLHFLRRLVDATTFDQYLLKKYLGAKVFSVEGAESLIPLLDIVIEKAAEQNIARVEMGMAHRGRLSVLANILGKSPRRIFAEFQDQAYKKTHGGDVKYHLGHTSEWTARGGRKVRLTLCFNPSHLEFVNPVALGALRAKGDREGDTKQESGLAILIHGDAAMAGEGIVQETLNLSQLPDYFTGGSLHVVVNNQIGFTTAPAMSRSGKYCTDIAKMLEVPILHVNGEEPEAVMRAVRIAMDFRQRFRMDVVIDLYCYRRHGHNEGDEPEFTQPVQYAQIKARKSIRDLYAQRLINEGSVTQADFEKMHSDFVERLEKEYTLAQSGEGSGPSNELADVWRGYRAGHEPFDEQVNTAVSRLTLVDLLERLSSWPEDFQPHPKVEKILAKRMEMARGGAPLDWAAAEALAFATLVHDGYRVRLTGQDSGRGTFSHRHAVLYDYRDGHPYVPLSHVAPQRAAIEIVNSPLSEAGALGFEYGYSLEYPDCLVAWEGQFGDFSNVAQVIIDQFITSAEEKWSHLSGITLLLPHGFEGQGPEHSSARLERFLNLSCEHNIQVVQPTTPAQFFHCLRRQMLRRWLKPLVILTPKSLLRHPKVLSPLDELTTGHFQRLIPDRTVDPAEVTNVLLCSGKIYYELLDKREETQRRDKAIVRIEQLYPFPDEQLRTLLSAYRQDVGLVWVQEEPGNMGAAQFLSHYLRDNGYDRLNVLARPNSASPATGSGKVHKREQQWVIAEALDYT